MSDLGAAVITHLDEQLESSRRLLNHVLRQGAAVRRQDVDGVLTCIAEIQGEMDRRGKLEQHRGAILAHAGAHLQTNPAEVTLDALATLVEPHEAAGARERSAELRGLLAEIQREHVVNRALMRQELAFLEHLTRLIGGEDDLGYGGSATTVTAPSQTHRVLDLRA
jgi:hypothetical protein